MTALALVLTWLAVTRDCRGGLEAQPVRYEVAYRLGFMRDSPVCPLDEQGRTQACVGWTTGIPVTQELSVTLPEPGVGEVTCWADPVAVDISGNRSDGCAP